MTKIVIAENHTMARYGTSMILRDLFPDGIILEAIDFEQLVQYAEESLLDLLILDINIPGGDNLQMISVIRLRQPSVRILVHSAYHEQLFALRYLKAGANGYLMKQAGENELKDAILTIMRNDVYLSPGIKQQLLFNPSQKRPAAANPIHALSNREIEVMQHLVKGTSLADISRKLSLQVSTVNTYKTRIFEKLNVHNVIELAQMVQLYH